MNPFTSQFGTTAAVQALTTTPGDLRRRRRSSGGVRRRGKRNTGIVRTALNNPIGKIAGSVLALLFFAPAGTVVGTGFGVAFGVMATLLAGPSVAIYRMPVCFGFGGFLFGRFLLSGHIFLQGLVTVTNGHRNTIKIPKVFFLEGLPPALPAWRSLIPWAISFFVKAVASNFLPFF